MGYTLGQAHAMICPEGVSACRKLEDLVAVCPISRAACFRSVKERGKQCEIQFWNLVNVCTSQAVYLCFHNFKKSCIAKALFGLKNEVVHVISLLVKTLVWFEEWNRFIHHHLILHLHRISIHMMKGVLPPKLETTHDGLPYLG